MDAFIPDLIKIFLQALFLLAIVLIAIWFYFRIRQKSVATPTENQVSRPYENEAVGTLKLQACERLILFLERITPNNLILRVHSQDMTASQLHAALIRTIREEFEYNLSQQLYVSAKTWEFVRNAKEETIRQINSAVSDMKEGKTARDLAGLVLQHSLLRENSPVTIAIEAVKQEIH